MLSGLINTIVLNIYSLGLITPSSVCHLRTEFWLAVSFGDFSPIGWNDTKMFDPKDILVDPARMSLCYSGSHAGSTKKSLKCPRGMKKTRSYSNTHLVSWNCFVPCSYLVRSMKHDSFRSPLRLCFIPTLFTPLEYCATKWRIMK